MYTKAAMSDISAAITVPDDATTIFLVLDASLAMSVELRSTLSARLSMRCSRRS